jgi:predicted transcriptional regulator
MKIAVSIPDQLFERADALAERLGKSRSQVYREALADYLARRESATVTHTLDELVDELGGGVEDWTAVASREALGRSEW